LAVRSTAAFELPPGKRIARELTISERTVKFHVSSILEKLGCGNRTQAVAAARRRGLILASLEVAEGHSRMLTHLGATTRISQRRGMQPS
jgi:hypothetical protein